MKAYVFPGQGSQKKGMGGDLFKEYSQLTALADTILGYSVEDLCLNDPDQHLGQTQYTQPALFIVNVFTWLKKLEQDGMPDYVAGHSLGEYNALFAAGVFDFETGLILVRERGALMSRAQGGGMAAVIGLEADAVRRVLKQSGETDVDVANFNSPAQIVLSGPSDRILPLKPLFMDAGARHYAPLKVSAAFHSRYMEPARKEFRRFLDNFTFEAPTIPVISNRDARPYDPEKLKTILAGQIDHSVRWTETVRYLMGLGVNRFEEVGPGKVLNKLCSVILKDCDPLVVGPEAAESEPPVTSAAHVTQSSMSPQPPSAAVQAEPVGGITAGGLGSALFKRRFGTELAYAAGSMGYGVSSKALVRRMSAAGLLSFFGSHGLEVGAVRAAIGSIRENSGGGPFGVNLSYQLDQPDLERELVDMLLQEQVRHVEASGYIQITAALVLYRLKGAVMQGGKPVAPNQVLAKVSRPEIAALFMNPAPERMVNDLVSAGLLSGEEAALSSALPMSDTICALSDGAWLTEQMDAQTLLPAVRSLRDSKMAEHCYHEPILVGSGGGIGTPDAAAAAFIQGSDFILTGSINLCSAEAGMSDTAKQMLARINVQDTECAPAEMLFEMGGRVRVLKRGVFFPMRANRLYDIFRHHQSLPDLNEKNRRQVEKYLGQDLASAYAAACAHYRKSHPTWVEGAERDGKSKLALIFKWYLQQGVQFALRGDEKRRTDFQIFCGPALGAYNQTPQGALDYKDRHVDEIGLGLMQATATLLNRQIAVLQGR